MKTILNLFKFILFYILFLLQPVAQTILGFIVFGGFASGIIFGVMAISDNGDISMWIPVSSIILGFLAHIGRDKYDLLILKLNPNPDKYIILDNRIGK